MPDVLFHGGPCDGIHTLVDDSALVDGKITCQGVVYDAREVIAGEWLATSTLPATPQPEQPLPLDGGLEAAWRELGHAVGRTVPALVNAAKRQRRRIRAAGML